MPNVMRTAAFGPSLPFAAMQRMSALHPLATKRPDIASVGADGRYWRVFGSYQGQTGRGAVIAKVTRMTQSGQHKYRTIKWVQVH
jgi:hypothetical protein